MQKLLIIINEGKSIKSESVIGSDMQVLIYDLEVGNPNEQKVAKEICNRITTKKQEVFIPDKTRKEVIMETFISSLFKSI